MVALGEVIITILVNMIVVILISNKNSNSTTTGNNSGIDRAQKRFGVDWLI